ncbi:MAG: twitching motility protein PilT [Polaromonas sp.]|nr:twitching motility protein PilT [Polaromonas sp.]
MKFAIDTNLLISSTFKLASPPGLVMAAWRMQHIEWISCDEQLEELSVALFRPKVLAHVIGGEKLALALLEEIRSNCDLKTLTHPLPSVCRDKKDDYLFALYDQHHVEMIVSGDKDVLALKGSYPIITARELIDRL